ncbi:uncharacterized protein LOC123560957 [Mercenaria mercenaria]|uniref:uncharacterized protein LOC123560957 n=1 Tax=Mercenaria mercenaria TaxID=6596 RepID=UPI001E1DB0A9|nr:uncharacterized protein LOC123560957 [Mercenaria mercenaria]
MAKCVLEGCGATRRNGISLHLFPKVPDLRTKWLNFIGRSEVAKSARMCEIHFDEKQFERSPALLKSVGQTSCLVRLRKEAIPSLVTSVSEAKRKVQLQTVPHDSAPEVKKRKSLEEEAGGTAQSPEPQEQPPSPASVMNAEESDVTQMMMCHILMKHNLDKDLL